MMKIIENKIKTTRKQRFAFNIEKDIHLLRASLYKNPWQTGDSKWLEVKFIMEKKFPGSVSKRTVENRVNLLLDNMKSQQLKYNSGTEEQLTERGKLLQDIEAIVAEEKAASQINKMFAGDESISDDSNEHSSDSDKSDRSDKLFTQDSDFILSSDRINVDRKNKIAATTSNSGDQRCETVEMIVMPKVVERIPAATTTNKHSTVVSERSGIASDDESIEITAVVLPEVKKTIAKKIKKSATVVSERSGIPSDDESIEITAVVLPEVKKTIAKKIKKSATVVSERSGIPSDDESIEITADVLPEVKKTIAKKIKKSATVVSERSGIPSDDESIEITADVLPEVKKTIAKKIKKSATVVSERSGIPSNDESIEITADVMSKVVNRVASNTHHPATVDAARKNDTSDDETGDLAGVMPMKGTMERKVDDKKKRKPPSDATRAKKKRLVERKIADAERERYLDEAEGPSSRKSKGRLSQEDEMIFKRQDHEMMIEIEKINIEKERLELDKRRESRLEEEGQRRDSLAIDTTTNDVVYHTKKYGW